MKIICKYESGSKSYGLNTINSDLDISFLFLNTDISKIIGLNRQDHQNNLNRETNLDVVGYELRHWLNLLKKSNTQSLEILHNSIWLEKTSEFDFIQANKEKLYDSEKMFKCFKGYALSEKDLIFGYKHQGRIGEKRKSAIEKFGYSFRNASHAIRLIRTATIFFKYNFYPLKITDLDKNYGNLIADIKFNPQNHKPENLTKIFEELFVEFEKSFHERKINYKFDENFANDLCYKFYTPILLNNN